MQVEITLCKGEELNKGTFNAAYPDSQPLAAT